MFRSSMIAGAAALMLAGCNEAQQDVGSTNPNAAAAAGEETLADGLGANSKFAAAIKAAGLAEALAGPTPYTVLAPTDAAFDKLPAGAVDTLMAPAGRKELTAVLTNHILPGTMLAADIAKAVDAGGGSTQIATLGGGTLIATRNGATIVIADGAGTKASVTGADGARSNGVIHQVDAVLMPTE